MANQLNKAKKKRILVVDDDVAMRTLLREILTGKLYEVIEAADGQQALDLIHKEPFDLMITDRSMPALGGLELLQMLRQEKIDIPALVVSAYGDEDMWAKAIGLGAEDYLLKPFTSDSVLSVVRKKLL